MTPDVPPAGGGKLRPWLQLMRFPAVFTALADIAAGYAIARRGRIVIGELLGLLTASAALYLAGMVFNDVFDRRRDAVARPLRPIPSGRISPQAAVTLGGLLVMTGLAAALRVSWQALLVAALLTFCIFLYDGLLKATPLGPLAMGACRMLNLILGGAVAGAVLELPASDWTVLTIPAVALGVYVAGITWFARTEETSSSRAGLTVGAVVANAGLLMLAASYYGVPAGLNRPWSPAVRGDMVALAVLAVAFTIDRRLFTAIAEPTPAQVQSAVKLMLLSIITIDATIVLAATGSVPLAVGTLLLLIPALLLGRWVYVT